jgi:hypothetical protein
MLIVTIAALVMAASLGWFAYRLLREEQRRADARVAVLTAALERTEPAGWDFTEPARHPEPTGFRPAAASAPAPVAASVSAADTSPTPQLVFIEDDTRTGRAFLSEGDAWPLRTSLAGSPGVSDSTPVESTQRTGGLFADVPAARPGDARGVVAVGSVILVALLAIAYAWSGGDSEPAAAPRATAASASASVSASAPASTTPAAGGVPLELLSLAHEQRKDGLVVRGSVRNPVAGSDRTAIVASVVLLDAAGGVLSSGRAPVRTAVLRPGQAAEFAVELPTHADVRRYRVTFRAADGSLVSHADRRPRRP